MQCKKCGYEYVEALKECPNCQAPNEPAETKILLPDERDTFEGVTIDDETVEGGSGRADGTDRQSETGGPRIFQTSVKIGGGLGIIWQLLFLVAAAAVVFVLLPAFLLVFLAIAAVYMILRMFR